MSKDLINWKALSIELSGSDNSIRKNQITKKHKAKIEKPFKDKKVKPKGTLCDVCGSDDIIEAPLMGRNCNTCNPI